jgi:hypothetical protein
MQQDYAADPKTAEEIRAFVREYEKGFNKHDAAALAALCTKDVIREGDVWKECMSCYNMAERPDAPKY